MNKDPKVIVAIAVVAILVIAGVAVAVVGINNNSTPAKHTNVEDMTFDEMVEAARGTTVNMGFYFDTYCKQWFDDYFAPLVKEKYDITLTNAGYVTSGMVIKDYEAMKAAGKTTGSYDFIWGRSSDYYNLLDVDGNKTSIILQSAWQDKMPNVVSYSDGLADETWEYTYNAIYGDNTYSTSVGSVAPFSGSVTNYVYNKAYNDSTVDWNNAKFTVTTYENGKVVGTPVVKTIIVVKDDTAGATVLDTATAVADIDVTKSYTRSSVEDYRIDKIGTVGDIKTYGVVTTGVFGVPSNYTELYSWLQLYPQQYYIPSVTNAGVNFHTQLILEAMIYELAAKGSSWTACTDKTADVWQTGGALAGKFVDGDDAKNKATYKTYIDETVFTVTDAASYETKIPYLKAYLTDLQPYLNKNATRQNSLQNTMLIGNNTTEKEKISGSTIMLALSTTESYALRDGAYSCSIGAYMMDTSCANRCGLFLLSNAPNPAGAIVVANLFNDPTVQATYYNISGNGYNVDTEKLTVDQKALFDSYIATWNVTGKTYLHPDYVDEHRTIATIGYREGFLNGYADKYIASTA